MEYLAFGLVGGLAGVGTKVARGLEEVGEEAGGAAAVVLAEADAEGEAVSVHFNVLRSQSIIRAA